MAQQLKKKFIGNDQIDGTKIQLLKDQSIRIENQAGQVINLLQLSADDKVLAKGEEIGLKSEIDAEQARAEAAEGVLQDNIDDEVDARIAADTALQNQINDIISNVDPSALDSLSEIVTAFQNADNDLSAAITAALGTHTSDLAIEVDARIAADSAAATDRAAIRTEFADADTALHTTISAEIDADVLVEKQRAETEEAAIRTDFAAADSAIQAELDATQVGAGLEANGSYVADELSYYIYEATSLKDADSKLDAKLAEEVSNLQSEDFTMLKLDGSRSMEADLSMSSESITEVITANSLLEDGASGAVLDAGIASAFGFDASNIGKIALIFSSEFLSQNPSFNGIITQFEEVFPVLQIVNHPSGDGSKVYAFDTGSLSWSEFQAQFEFSDPLYSITYVNSALVSSKIVGLADGVDAGDAVNKGQLDAAVSAAASDVSDLQGEFDAYVTSNNGALANEVSARETLEDEFDAYVVSNNAALADEVSDRQTADTTLQANIDVEKGRIDAILLAADADKDSFAEIVTLINSIDTDNDNAFAGYVSSNNARVLAVEEEVDTLQDEMDAVEGRLDVIEPKVTTLESEMDVVEGRATTLESEMDTAEGRLDAIEAEAFYKEQIVVSAAMVSAQKITLAEVPEANSVVAFVGRLALHEGASQDYEMNGADLEFRGDIATGGVSALAEGDVITVSYYK